MDQRDAKQLVKTGYNEMALAYHEQRDQFKNQDLLARFLTHLPAGAALLDVGCGSGMPVARFLADAGCIVTGIDLSSSMLTLARAHVPEATFLEMDMGKLTFSEASFDGVSAFYSVFHVPRASHRSIFEAFYRVLKPGGVLLLSSGSTDWEGVEAFHGHTMYWSHYGPRKTRALVEQAGFAVLYSEVLAHGGERHYWVLARKGDALPL